MSAQKFLLENNHATKKMSRLNIPIHTHTFTTTTYVVFKRVAIDTIGALSEDPDRCR
jgi:hypothetical protein